MAVDRPGQPAKKKC